MRHEEGAAGLRKDLAELEVGIRIPGMGPGRAWRAEFASADASQEAS